MGSYRENVTYWQVGNILSTVTSYKMYISHEAAI